MSAELVPLGLRIESDQVDVADKRLDRMAESAGRAERATDKLAGGSRAANGAIAQMVASIETGVRDLVAMGQAQMILAQHTQQTTAATNGFATATGAASTATMRFSATFTPLQQGATASGAALQQLDSHMDAYRASLQQASAAASAANDNLGKTAVVHGRATASSKAMTQATLNLTRQLSDVGVTAAMGMNPFMILIQQGPQIADAFQMAATQGLGFTAVLRGMWATLSPFLVALAPIALAVGAVAGGFALFHRELSKQYPTNITDGLDLTDKQLEKVKHTTVTFGDTLSATFKVVGERIMNGPIGEGLTWLGQRFSEIMNFVANVVFEAAARIYGVFAGTYKTIIENWRSFPAVLGDIAITAINYLIRAFNQLPAKIAQIASQVLSFFAGAWGGIKAGAEALPGAIQAAFGRAFRGAIDIARSAIAAIANGLKSLSTAALDAFRGTAEAAPEIGARIAAGVSNALAGAPLISAGPMIQELENQFAGAGEGLVANLVGNIASETENARTAMRQFGSDVASAALAGAQAQALEEAGKAEADAAGARQRQAREVKEIQTLWANVNQELRALNVSVPEILDPLDLAVRNLTQIDDLVRSAGRGMEESFGRAGKALSGLAEGLSGYRLQMAEIAQAEKDGKLWGREAILERGRVEAQTYGDMASAAKGFFGEKTAAYKALQGVEMAYRALQFANAVRAMALDTTETGSSIANSLARGAAKAAEAVADIFAKLGPWGFPVAAAALAVMAGVGLKALGGGSGGGVPTLPTTNTGTGTVLGGGGEASESLTKSLDMSERYWNRDLDYSSKMVSSLRAIQTNIGSLTTAIAREMNVGGGLDPTGLNQGPSTSGGFLGIGRTTTTANVVGSGINLQGGSLSDLIERGVSGALYQIVQTTRTSSGFLGIGGGTRTTNSEVTTGLDGGLSRELSRVLASLRSGVLTAAGQLGVEGAEAALDAFQVNLGRISFEGMDAAGINAALNAVLSAAGDEMVRAILPGLDTLQQAGEGLFETLSRLATEYQMVDQVMTLLGKTFGPVGLASLEARARLVELAGGLEAFSESANFFAENFLTEAQRIAPVQAAVTAELTRLGLATSLSRSQFADLVMGLDVSTEGGASMYAALMRLAPALDQVISYTDDLTGAVVDQSELLRQRRSLEIALMEAQGDAMGAEAARRADLLAAMTPSLRALQELVWATNDAAEANRNATAAQEEAARVAEAEAARIAQINRERRSMEATLMELTGNAAGALAVRRALELENMEASLRPLQQLIYAQTDLNAARAAEAAAVEAAAQAARERVEQARTALTAAYEREAGALRTTIDRFRGFSEALATFRRGLGIEGLNAGASFQVTKADFERTSALARVGNEQALGDLQGVSEAYLEQSRSYSKTSLDYLRDLATVREAVQAAEETAGRQASIAEQQLSALDASVAGLLQVNESVLSVVEAIEKLRVAQAAAPSTVTTAVSGGGGSGVSGAGAVANSNRNWGIAENYGVNQMLAHATGYLGDFGSGGWQAWITQQDASTKATARFILENAGQQERIVNFATGGIFRNGIVSQPTLFDIGRMGEAGEEAIMPLTMGPNGLGVRAVGQNDNSDVVAALGLILSALMSMVPFIRRTEKNTLDTSRVLQQVTLGGVAVQTEEAA